MLLQRFPNKASLAMAVHKELGGGHNKKKMSRLKRIILRERADKAATQAGTAAEQAVEALAKSKSALQSLQKQLKVIGSRVHVACGSVLLIAQYCCLLDIVVCSLSLMALCTVSNSVWRFGAPTPCAFLFGRIRQHHDS